MERFIGKEVEELEHTVEALKSSMERFIAFNRHCFRQAKYDFKIQYGEIYRLIIAK